MGKIWRHPPPFLDKEGCFCLLQLREGRLPSTVLRRGGSCVRFSVRPLHFFLLFPFTGVVFRFPFFLSQKTTLFDEAFLYRVSSATA